MIEATTVTVYNARCDRCDAEHDTPNYSDRDDLLHDLRVMGWLLDDLDECPACLHRDDLERPNAAHPCPHDWHYIDRFDLLYCSRCKATLDPDDDPGDDAA